MITRRGFLSTLATVPLLGQLPPAPTHALVGARLVGIADSPTIDDATILIRAGRIEAVGPTRDVQIPPGTRTTTLSGKFVLPGLLSAHTHVSDVDGLRPRAYTTANTVRQLGVFARYGITTVWSLGGEEAPAFQVRDGQSVSSLDHARIFLAGEIITARAAGDARQAVARVAATRPDVIKIRVDDNLGAAAKMTPEVYRAIIEEAHSRKLRVAAHVFYLDDAKDLLRADVDVVVHSVRDRDVDDEFLALLKARQVAYVPTLTRDLSTFIYGTTPAFFGDPFFSKEADPMVVAQLREPARQAAMRASATAQRYRAGLEVAMRNLKRVGDAGLLVAMGTDSGPFPERFQGYFEHLEMEMMVQAGLTPAQVLRATTVDAAKAMRVEGVGTLAPGAWADLLVLDHDPRQDIRNTRQISSVWIAGNPIKR
jgi:imidazolonepropionase-like amidohydrolase